MTKEWYSQHGFAVSVNIEQSVIDRAESDAMTAYVKPIIPTADGTEEWLQPLLANITFAIILQRSLKVTRKGTKTKTDANSINEGLEAALREQSGMAKFAIEQLRKQPNAKACAKVNDIARLYYRTILLGD